MKVIKEGLLMNDACALLDGASEDVVLVQRIDKSPIVLMSLEAYNELKEELYKKGA